MFKTVIAPLIIIAIVTAWSYYMYKFMVDKNKKNGKRKHR